MLQRSVRVRRGHVVVEDHVLHAGGLALQEARQLILMVVEECHSIAAPGRELADGSAGKILSGVARAGRAIRLADPSPRNHVLDEE